jgi:hypothetical protein
LQELSCRPKIKTGTPTTEARRRGESLTVLNPGPTGTFRFKITQCTQQSAKAESKIKTGTPTTEARRRGEKPYGPKTRVRSDRNVPSRSTQSAEGAKQPSPVRGRGMNGNECDPEGATQTKRHLIPLADAVPETRLPRRGHAGQFRGALVARRLRAAS